ncbi:hypothetical protein B4900_13665 [Yersinia rohdei]|nr:hypothetical protein B4900_13665 [Yersinia rohdei]
MFRAVWNAWLLYTASNLWVASRHSDSIRVYQGEGLSDCFNSEIMAPAVLTPFDTAGIISDNS